MFQRWTFGQKLGAGFAVTVALAVAISAVAVYALRGVVAGKDRVITVDAQLLIDAQRLNAAFERKTAAARGFLLTGEEPFVGLMTNARSEFIQVLDVLQRNVYTDEGGGSRTRSSDPRAGTSRRTNASSPSVARAHRWKM